MTFYLETNFRATPDGKIPSDWRDSELGAVATELIGGGTPSTAFKEYWNGNVAWMTSAHINGMNIIKGQKYITKQGLENSATHLVPKDNLLVATRVGIGKTAVNKIDIAISQDLTGVIIDKNKADPVFLYWAILTSKQKLKALAQGSTIKGILRDDLSKLRLPMPTKLQEQRAIVGVLGVVDSAVDLSDRVIAKTERLKKGLMQQLLTRGIGHIEYKNTPTGNIPREWDIVKLEDIAAIRYGLGQPPESDKEGVPMIRATNIERGAIIEKDLLRVKRTAIPESRTSFLHEGDLIVVRSGAYTGDIGYITKKWEGAIAGYDLVVAPSKRVNSLFLSYYLLLSKVQTYFAQLKSRSAQPHLNSEQVANTPIALPPLSEQNDIAKILSTVDAKLQCERDELSTLSRIKRSLMDLLLTGKVRIKVG